ncbi:elongation factor P 5-aminopentanone reductase [Gracilibacillus phocaeensis]|uniref:elongation factor P 5-aminopentanone reductase n=1 Tax=Gracilibacillus phocaeensis TaxID=2042304 RepID=UPI0033071142
MSIKKTTLITGASGDIGKEIALQLASEGHQLWLHYHQNHAAIEKLKQQLTAEQVLGIIQADLSTPVGLDTFVQECPENISHYIHTSGQSYVGLFQDMSDAQMDQMLQLHVKAPWKIAQQLIPSMIQAKHGRIVLISSIWGEIGASCEVAYSSVKGAQNSFVKALAKELGPSQIYVNGVCPGLINTKMNHHLTEKDKQTLQEEIPLQRTGLPQDVAGAVGFLCQESTRYIQGEQIRVDGGWH